MLWGLLQNSGSALVHTAALAGSVISSYTAILLLQRAQRSPRARLWRVASALALAAASITALGSMLLAQDIEAMPAASLVLVAIGYVALAVLAIQYTTREDIGFGTHALHATFIGLGLCLTAHRGLGLANPDQAQDLMSLLPVTIAAVIGSSIMLSILRGLRVMPRALLRPRPLAGLFVGSLLTFTPAAVLSATGFTDTRAMELIADNATGSWNPMVMSVVMMAVMAIVIRLVRQPRSSSPARNTKAWSGKWLTRVARP